ncbi:hybrid sensor histidine kinase/response regulator [Sneathiella glossodoripedis]|uniref:hybrid sensor histidine kinase/response regulator n=1 Tax=Sneathiella glossodoripedis TaxID=418853 RepID=UPI0004706173|nr:PAS domain-containing sensor histidine kinase [Sneathiella glossodoripedis]
MSNRLDIDSILLDALENASDAFVVYDKAGRVLSCNRQFKAIYDYTESLINSETTIRDLVQYDLEHGNVVDISDRLRVTKILSEDRPYVDYSRRNFILRLSGNRYVSVHEHLSDKGSIVSIQREVTDLIVKQEEASRSAELFKAVFDSSSNISSLTVFDTGVFLDVNRAWVEAVGYSRSEAVGRSALELGIWPTPSIRKQLIKELQTNSQLRNFSSTIKTRDGEVRKILLNSEVLDISGTKVLYLSARDITDRLQTEFALSESEKRFSDFNNASSDWYWETDRQFKYTFISSKVEAAFGIPARDYIGSTTAEIVGQGARNQANMRFMFEQMAAKKPFRDLLLYRFRKPDGAKKWIRTSGLPYYDDSGEFCGYRGSTADVTERIELEEQLENSRRMEAVGQLSGGVAHDFNNILAVIQGNAEYVAEVLGDKFPELEARLQAMMRATDKGAELTQSMLAFSRSQRLSPSAFRLDEFVKQIMKEINGVVGPSVSLKTDFDPDLWKCNADVTQLEFALLNLCMNARDAMNSVGTLTIETRNKVVDDSYVLMESSAKPGKYVSLIVSDTGSGIPPEVMPHVMEPFYTTKDVGKGSGLGLSMVYGFATQSGGTLSIYSEEGIGTTVQLLLPALAADEKQSSDLNVNQSEALD